MVTRRQVISLVVAVFAISAMGVGLTTIGETSSIDRPETGQAPNVTTTPVADTDSAATGRAANPLTYRVTATNQSALNHTQLSQHGEVGTQAGDHIEVTLTRANATRVANLSWVESITPARQGAPAGGASSANESTVRTVAQQSAFPTGDDVKVGVIDHGFDTSNPVIADQVASVRSFRDSPGDTFHGTSVAEIVATGAPNSSLYLASIGSGTDTEAAISALVEQDVDIIVMSLAWFVDDNGDHFLTDDVNMAREQGVLFVNSAGNNARVHWEGGFQSTDGDQFHEWAPNDERNCIPDCQSTFSGELSIRLDWENDGDGSQYRLHLYNPVKEEYIATSDQYRGDDSAAILSTNVPEQPIDLIIENVEGPADDEVEITVWGPRSIQHSVAASSLGPPADVPSVVSVAAYESDNNRIAPYSSQGPTDTGQRGVDITGYTNLELSSGTFAGTSAAAPYIAFVAALVQDASSDDLSPAELEAAMTRTAIDLGPTGPDPVSGAGLVNVTAAVASVQPDNDRFEPNDERETATTIQPGTYQELQIVPGDRDYFAVELAANTSLTATAQFSHQTGDLELGVYGPGGELQAASTSITDNETVQLNRTATAGTYYLLVVGATNDTVAPYSLIVETEQVPTASVHIANQTTGGATVSVAEATLPEGGFVTLHDASLVDGATFDSVVGSSQYLPPGTHENINISVDIPQEKREQLLIAMPHRDTDEDQVYDFLTSEGADDAPYTTLDRSTILTDSATIEVRSPSEVATVDGAAFAVPESLEDEVDTYRDNVSQDVPAYAFVLATQNDLYVIFTDQEPKKGVASVEGAVLGRNLSTGNLTYGVINATDTSYNTTGTEVRIQEVVNDSSQYRLELVRVNAHYRRVSTLTDPDEEANVTLSTTSGIVVDNPQTVASLFTNPGRNARALTRNTSAEQIDRLLNDPQGPHLHTFSFETAFWADAEATIDAIVLDPASAAQQFVDEYDRPGIAHAEDGEPLLYVVDEDFQPQQVENVSQVKSRSKSLDGEIIEIEARLYQEKISVQETLEHNTGCGTDLLEIQTPQGPACVNVVQDNLLHGGVAWNRIPQSRNDTLLVAGISSRHQDAPVEVERGRYRIEGEVVSTSKINKSLPNGSALVIYSMERSGNISYDDVAQEARRVIETQTDELTTTLRPAVGEETIVTRYDEDNSGTIDNQELLAALADYPEQLSDTELLELLSVYKS